jgi:arylsulfatase A-like enzyme
MSSQAGRGEAAKEREAGIHPELGNRKPSVARQFGAFASALALVAALLYVAAASYRIFVLGVFGNVSRDVLWMSPLSNLLWFGMSWAACAALARLIGGDRGFRVGLGGLFTAFVYSLLLPLSAIDRVAALILAAGIATSFVQHQQRFQAQWLRGARLTRNVLAIAFLAASIVAGIVTTVAHRKELARLKKAPPGAPNVIFLVIDTMRGDVLQAAGYQRQVMPFLDSLAANGAYFPYAFATAPWTLPSHGSMFTGQYARRLNTTVVRPLSRGYRTLGEVFEDAGFYTVGVTSNLHYTNWESGINQGFLEWHDYRRSFRQVLRSSFIGELQLFIEISDARSWQDVADALKRHDMIVYRKPAQHESPASQITDRFVSWYDRRPARPFLAFINYVDAHRPYAPPRPYRTKFTQHPKPRDLYDGELAYVDDQLRRLLTELGRRGALENTYVVITSDHGEQFGEHKLTDHGNSLYGSVLRVPIIIIGPGIGTRRIEHAVSLRDIPETILALARVKENIGGVSLTGYFTDSSFRSSPVLSALMGNGSETGKMWQSYIDDEFHLLPGPNNGQLYRYRVDPAERNNLARIDSLELTRVRADLRRAITSQSLQLRSSATADVIHKE